MAIRTYTDFLCLIIRRQKRDVNRQAAKKRKIVWSTQKSSISIGDTRRNKMYQPLAFKVMEKFLKQGFTLKEDIIKKQHNCQATGFWINKSKDFNFLLIMHEHLFVFQK